MSTRSRIGMKMSDGKIKSIYCHWDGYPEGVGRTLLKHYQDSSKIEELLGLGDISSLGEFYDEKLSKSDWTRFDGHQKNSPIMPKVIAEKTAKCTVAYKDRGEDCPARVDEDEEEFIEKLGLCSEEYTYLYKKDYDGVYHWTVCETPWFQDLEVEDDD